MLIRFKTFEKKRKTFFSVLKSFTGIIIIIQTLASVGVDCIGFSLLAKFDGLKQQHKPQDFEEL